MEDLDQVTATAIDLGMRFGPKLLVAILILAAGVFAGRWAGRSTVSMLARFHLEPPVTSLLARIAWASPSAFSPSWHYQTWAWNCCRSSRASASLAPASHSRCRASSATWWPG